MISAVLARKRHFCASKQCGFCMSTPSFFRKTAIQIAKHNYHQQLPHPLLLLQEHQLLKLQEEERMDQLELTPSSASESVNPSQQRVGPSGQCAVAVQFINLLTAGRISLAVHQKLLRESAQRSPRKSTTSGCARSPCAADAMHSLAVCHLRCR
jgi:hypothetical protein